VGRHQKHGHGGDAVWQIKNQIWRRQNMCREKRGEDESKIMSSARKRIYLAKINENGMKMKGK